MDERDWDARVGDGIAVESRRLGGPRRTGVIREILGPVGDRYYLVRWEDGRETTFHPGSDAVLEPARRRRRPARQPAKAAPRSAPTAPPSPLPPRAAPRGSLRASAGDRLVIKGHRLGAPPRDAEILDVLGPDGTAPFRVRWSDTGRESVFFPGADAGVEHLRGPRKRRRQTTQGGS